MSWFKSFFKARPTPGNVGPFDPSDSDDAMCNFTPRAQQVIALSRREADRFHHNFVGTEHLLLGLIALGQGTAVNVLRKLGLNLEAVRDEVEKQVGTGPEQKFRAHIPLYTPRVKKVLALAAKEARALGHTYVGTEHILLGMIREGDGVAARVLKSLEVDTETARLEILKELDPINHTAMEKQPPTPEIGSIDIAKRYDVYCAEGDQKVVVYHNAQFKGRARLLGRSSRDDGAEFLELEQSNGQRIFLSSFTVIKFCEHGGKPNYKPEALQ